MDSAQLTLGDADIDGRLDLPQINRSPSVSKARAGIGGYVPDERAMVAAASFVGDLLAARESKEPWFLVSCSKTKHQARASAIDLYTSPLFVRSAELAQRLGIPVSILSAKHGLVSAKEKIDPYDQSLKSCSSAERRAWAQRVVSAARSDIGTRRLLILLAGSTYSDQLLPLLDEEGWTVSRPLVGMALGERLAFLGRAHRILDRRDALTRFYDDAARMASRIGLKRLPDLLKEPIHTRGVYFFFDPEEPTVYSGNVPRLVRIGTHGVSANSKASLRMRLKTHLGTAAGLGSHRSSVFRLHVGEAMLRRDGLSASLPTWGQGQSANTDVTRTEADLEREVSKYISRLLVLCVNVDDEPTKASMRAVLERNAIALFTEALVTLDPASDAWLGRCSRQSAISRSGLWNVRSVGDHVDLRMAQELSAKCASTEPAGDRA